MVKGTYLDKSGYVYQLRPDWYPSASNKRYVFQHRVIMGEYLGRALLPHEEVHHINGIRDDNRLENLELWSHSQPCGQRVEDKLRWAREIIDLYG